MNNTPLALMHFSWAMDLDPKGANSQIKDALDPTLNRAQQEDAAAVATGTDNTAAQVQQDETMQTDNGKGHANNFCLLRFSFNKTSQC